MKNAVKYCDVLLVLPKPYEDTKARLHFSEDDTFVDLEIDNSDVIRRMYLFEVFTQVLKQKKTVPFRMQNSSGDDFKGAIVL